MPTRARKFLFGRLNILIGTDKKMTFLRDALASRTLIERRGSRWGIFDSRPIDHTSGDSFLAASLVKFRPLTTEEVVDEARHRLTTANIEDLVERKSAFFLHVTSGVIAFEDARPSIDAATFRKRTAEVINEALGKFFANAEIQGIDEDLSFLEVVRKFKRVLRYTVSLHPSNPSNRGVWAAVDARIKKLGVQQYKEDFSAPTTETGLAVLEDEEIRAKTIMAQDGYGKATAKGEGDNGLRTVTTHDNPVSASVDASLTDDHTVLEALWDKFGSIFRRLRE